LSRFGGAGKNKMANRNDISNELKGLESALANINPHEIYAVPDGYFESLANLVLNRVKALEATNAKEELEILSPMLSTVSKEIPFTVPTGYFENLSENIIAAINKKTDYKTSEEEIESLSPLLNSISKKNLYSVPAGYFENLNPVIEKKEAKVISFNRHRWYRLAAAASVIGVIAIGALFFINQSSVDINKNPQAWVKKNVSKKISQEQLNEFVTLAEGDENLTDLNDSDSEKSVEVETLIKDVSEKELQEFLNEAVALESNDGTDAIMN
jgi:hypothetical protein